jgi:von Willebrand factor type A domain
MSLSLKLLLLLLLSSAAQIQAQSASSCKDYIMTVNALDANGVPAENLTEKDFRVSYQGRPVRLLWSEHRQPAGGRVVVLLDTSGSMKEDFGVSTKWKIAHAAALEFVTSEPPDQQVSLIDFATEVHHRFDSLGGRKPMEAWLNDPSVTDGKEIKGQTALAQEIQDVLKELGPTSSGDSVYVITDGIDNFSKENFSQVAHYLHGVRIFAFLLNNPITAEDASGRDLYDLRRSGGGLISISPTAFGPSLGDRVMSSIRASTRTLQLQMASFYILGIQPPDTISKGDHWKVDVVDVRGYGRKDLTVAHPQALVSAGCAGQSARRDAPAPAK